MRLPIIIITICSLVFIHKTSAISAQELNTLEKHKINATNKKYRNNEKELAATEYLKIIAQKPSNDLLQYNLATVQIDNGAIEEGRKLMESAIGNSSNTNLKSQAHYNIGNTYLKEQKWEDAKKAYIESLKNNPKDEEAKYNLAYVNAKIKEQQQNNKDQDKKDNKKDQENQKDKNKDNQKQDQQQESDDKQEQNRKKQQQQQPKRMSKEQAEQNMKALRAKEQKLHQKKNSDEQDAIIAPNQKDW